MRKYRNTKIEASYRDERVVFDSKAEYQRFAHLCLLQRAGEISNLELQPSFRVCEPFKRNGRAHRAVDYVADFRYRTKDGAEIVEDVKGVKTAVYQLKKKLFLSRYGDAVRFVEVMVKGKAFIEKHI